MAASAAADAQGSERWTSATDTAEFYGATSTSTRGSRRCAANECSERDLSQRARARAVHDPRLRACPGRTKTRSTWRELSVHEAIADAIVAGDVEAARAAAEAHSLHDPSAFVNPDVDAQAPAPSAGGPRWFTASKRCPVSSLQLALRRPGRARIVSASRRRSDPGAGRQCAGAALLRASPVDAGAAAAGVPRAIGRPE